VAWLGHDGTDLESAEPSSARNAFDVGFVNAMVVRDEGLRSAAIAKAVRIARKIRQRAKRLWALAAKLGPQLAREPADWPYCRVNTSESAQEGPCAFAETRHPVWWGR
jgi:enoyl-CoA hydratase/carnithine racemase